MQSPLELKTPDAVWFRAACNAAVDSKDRPLSRSILQRISDATVAAELFEQIWSGLAPDRRTIPQFFTSLESNAAWRTFVRGQAVSMSIWSRIYGASRTATNATRE